jgi:hypothetical protein
VTGIGIGLAFGAYTLGLWGYCLIRGYNVPFTSMFGQTWPAAAPGTQISGSAILTPSPGHQLGTITGNEQIITPS